MTVVTVTRADCCEGNIQEGFKTVGLLHIHTRNFILSRSYEINVATTDPKLVKSNA